MPRITTRFRAENELTFFVDKVRGSINSATEIQVALTAVDIDNIRYGDYDRADLNLEDLLQVIHKFYRKEAELFFRELDEVQQSE